MVNFFKSIFSFFYFYFFKACVLAIYNYLQTRGDSLKVFNPQLPPNQISLNMVWNVSLYCFKILQKI